MPPDVLYIDNDNVVYLSGLRNEVTGEYINDALLSAELTDTQDVAVAGQSWPLIMDYVAGTQGIYRLLLENTLALLNGQYYKLNISGTGDGLTLSQSFLLKAVSRFE